jgi:PAS domain S-box-containing protein
MQLHQPARPSFLRAEGAVVSLLGGLPGSTGRLGPPAAWPAALQNVLRLILRSNFPMAVIWGEDRILLYNDAYIPMLGNKHPRSLGAPIFEVWPEVRSFLEPILDSAYAGESTYLEDAPFLLERYDYPEQTFFTFAYAPVEDENGTVVGACCTCTETTGKVQAELRQSFLLDLEQRLRELVEPLDVIVTAERALGEHLGASRVGYGEVDESGRFFTTPRNWTDGTVAHQTGTHDLLAFGPDVLDAMRRGDVLVIDNAFEDPRSDTPEHQAAFVALEASAVVTVNLIKQGRLKAALYVHDRHPRRWTEGEVELIRNVAERTWSAAERARAEVALRESEDHHRHFIDLSPQVPWTASPAGQLLTISSRWEDLTGMPIEEALGGGWSKALHPDDLEPLRDAAGRSMAAGEPLDIEHRILLKSGSYGWMRSRAYPRRDEQGTVLRWYGTSEDINDRKRFEQHQRLLINELNHRVKNTLATVQSLARQTFKQETGPGEGSKVFESRLLALSAAHDILTRENWEGAELSSILAKAVEPFVQDGRERLEFEGPAVRIAPRIALSLSMAVHELGTNAVKYGSLSVPNGRVWVEWTLAQSAPAHLVLHWQERGGPPVEPPTRQGFGTRLIVRSLAQELAGKVHLTYGRDGLECVISAPITDD